MKDRIPSGILVVDKPKGMTSHDVVDIVRRLFKIRKVGHAGTLDPIATGVLVILVGSSATKKSNLLINDDKEYTARLRLGIATDTGDAFGKTTYTANPSGLDRVLIKKTIMNFKGELKQIPPMYSSVKFKGKSLYKWARRGITIPREPRKIIIKCIHIKEISLPDIVFDITCSKGTYIRQLCIDIGKSLGCGGHMTDLIRTRSGSYGISKAINVEKLKTLTTEELHGLLI